MHRWCIIFLRTLKEEEEKEEGFKENNNNDYKSLFVENREL